MSKATRAERLEKRKKIKAMLKAQRQRLIELDRQQKEIERDAGRTRNSKGLYRVNVAPAAKVKTCVTGAGLKDDTSAPNCA